MRGKGAGGDAPLQLVAFLAEGAALGELRATAGWLAQHPLAVRTHNHRLRVAENRRAANIEPKVLVYPIIFFVGKSHNRSSSLLQCPISIT